MRLGKPRCARWAAWLGLFALALNALVPIHVAFDLAEAFGAAQPRGAHSDARGAEWSILARLVGHSEANGEAHGHGKSHDHGKAKPTPCPVCSALSALAGFVPAAVVALPPSPLAATPAALAAIVGEPASVPLAYRSRAPPVA